MALNINEILPYLYLIRHWVKILYLKIFDYSILTPLFFAVFLSSSPLTSFSQQHLIQQINSLND